MNTYFWRATSKKHRQSGMCKINGDAIEAYKKIMEELETEALLDTNGGGEIEKYLMEEFKKVE